MAYRKTAVTPLLKHWSYCSLALSHRYDIFTHILQSSFNGTQQSCDCLNASEVILITGRELRSGVKCVVVIIVTVLLRPSVFHSIQFQRYRRTNHSEPVTIVKTIHFTPERSSLPVLMVWIKLLCLYQHSKPKHCGLCH